MTGNSIRMASFVQAMHEGLSERVAARSGDDNEYFTMRVPDGYTNEEIEEAAAAMHQGSHVVLFGICCGSSRFSMPFVAMRIFTHEGYVAFERDKINARTGLGLFAAFLSVASAWGLFAFEHSLGGVIALVIAFIALLLSGLSANEDNWGTKPIPIPAEPVRDFVPYYDWH